MNQSLIAAALLGTVLFAINAASYAFGWYESVPNFDKGMHIVGGIFIACAGAWCWERLRPSVRVGFVQLMMTVFVIGILWEGYEYVIEALIGAELATLPDSALDLVADMVGGAIGACFVLKGKKRYNERNARN